MAGTSGDPQPGAVSGSGEGRDAPDRGEQERSKAVPAVVERALTAAAAEVAATWSGGAGQAASASDVRIAVSCVADAVRRAAGGGTAAVGSLPPFVPARLVLERLRKSFLDQLRALDALQHAADALRVLRAFEEVQDELDSDAAHRFAARLTGPQAQQLVVEMAHDMRSPLGSILILAERLRAGAGGELSPVQQRQLGLIYSAAFGLSALAGDVIELARGGTTLLEKHPMAFAVSDILQSILDILRPMAEEKRITMRALSPVMDVRVGHPLALNRVLLNLATNAVKFTNVGSVEITCQELDRTQFSVKDTGRGIPPQVLQDLFQTFRQRQGAGDYAFSSAGLGLSICQKLVRAMGGELEVETELERGTRFHFTLELPPAERL
jgi:signal transduction histidine kinase